MKVFIKVSGECFSSSCKIQHTDIAKAVKVLLKNNISAHLLTGGGNIFRGRDNIKESPYNDYKGMYATIINSIDMFTALRANGVEACLMSDIVHSPIFMKYSTQYIENYSGVVVFGGGAGIPFITTDTASVIRALELKCDYMLKLTNVDGLFTSDPNLDSNAKFLKSVTYDEYLEKSYNIIDDSAVALARENNLKIIVTNSNKLDNLYDICTSHVSCTVIQK